MVATSFRKLTNETVLEIRLHSIKGTVAQGMTVTIPKSVKRDFLFRHRDRLLSVAIELGVEDG